MIQNQTKKSGRSPDIQSTEICRFFVYVCGQKLCILQIFHLEPVFLAVSIHFGAFITADRTGPVDDPRTDKIRIMTDFQIFQFRTSVEDPLANVAQVFRKNYVGEIFAFEKSTVINKVMESGSSSSLIAQALKDSLPIRSSSFGKKTFSRFLHL